MTQSDIDIAVGQATGDSLKTIRQRGFSLADPLEVNFDPEPDNRPPQTVDWDMRELEQNVALFAQPFGILPGLA